MFDVGFSEMIVIAIVALVVLGPEKLPGIARTVGKFYGSMQRYMSGFKADIEREVALDNMRKATAEAQQKLLELQSQVKVLSGEIPELAAQASAGGSTGVNDVFDALPSETPAGQHDPQVAQHAASQGVETQNVETQNVETPEAGSKVALDHQAHSQQQAANADNVRLVAGDRQEGAKEDEVLWKKKA